MTSIKVYNDKRFDIGISDTKNSFHSMAQSFPFEFGLDWIELVRYYDNNKIVIPNSEINLHIPLNVFVPVRIVAKPNIE